jgi:hypothetical protein
VEKNIPLDEIWDEFKYDSFIDDDWSRTHYYRESTEVMGGELESSAVLDNIGFLKSIVLLIF